MSLALAMDIGGTKLATGLVDRDGSVLGFQRAPALSEEGPEAMMRRLFDLARISLTSSDGESIAAVGISCGGPLDAAQGFVLSPPNLPSWDRIPIGPLASAAFDVPFVLENDATAGAYGDFRYGVARGSTSALYLTLSTGVGGGVILDGKLHRGALGNGGEFGHITVRPRGRLCTCGRHGCLEAYASGTSIAARASEAVRSGARTSLALLNSPPTAADVSDHALRLGDPVATEIWRDTLEILAQAVTDLANIFEPDIVVLGGGVTRAGRHIAEFVGEAVRASAMPSASPRVDISPLDDRVCLLGVGAIALERIPERKEAVLP